MIANLCSSDVSIKSISKKLTSPQGGGVNSFDVTLIAYGVILEEFNFTINQNGTHSLRDNIILMETLCGIMPSKNIFS